MLRKATCLVLLLVLLCGICSTAAAGDEHYKWIITNDKFSVYYDTDTVKYSNSASSGKTVDVWLKFEFTETAAREEAEKYSEIITDHDWTNFSYYLSRVVFDSNNKMKTVSTVYYDRRGNSIFSIELPNSKWQDIVPGTASQKIYSTFRSYLRSK